MVNSGWWMVISDEWGKRGKRESGYKLHHSPLTTHHSSLTTLHSCLFQNLADGAVFGFEGCLGDPLDVGGGDGGDRV